MMSVNDRYRYDLGIYDSCLDVIKCAVACMTLPVVVPIISCIYAKNKWDLCNERSHVDKCIDESLRKLGVDDFHMKPSECINDHIMGVVQFTLHSQPYYLIVVDKPCMSVNSVAKIISKFWIPGMSFIVVRPTTNIMALQSLELTEYIKFGVCTTTSSVHIFSHNMSFQVENAVVNMVDGFQGILSKHPKVSVKHFPVLCSSDSCLPPSIEHMR